MSETPEQKWNRVQKKLQDSILKCYPNPNREGCPGEDAIAELAKRAADLAQLDGDERWEHVTHCSPCYKEYLDARDWLRENQTSKSERKK
jgi:hypothetical protein